MSSRRELGRRCDLTAVIIVGGGIAGLAAAYELQRRGVAVRPARSARARRRRDPERGGRRLHHRRRPRRAAGPEARRHRALRGARPRRSAGADQAAAPRLHPARRAAASAAGRVGARHSDARRTVRRARGCSRGRASCGWAPSCSCRARRDDARRIDRRVHDAALRRGSHDLPRRAAAGRHSCRRRRSVVACGRCFRGSSRRSATHGSLLRAFRSDARAARRRSAGRRVSIAARRPERDGRARSSRAIGRTRRPARTPVVASQSPDGGRRSRCETVGPATPSTRAPWSWRRRPTSTGALLRGIATPSSRGCAARFRTRRPRPSRSPFAASDVAHPLNGSGFVVPRVEQTGILAASWLSSKWPHRAPDGPRAAADVRRRRARSATRSIDPTTSSSSASLAALTPLLGIRGEPLLTRVYRWERASAQHEVGHLARMAAIERALARHPGSVRDRQRLPRRRDPRLRRRRPRDRAAGGRVARHVARTALADDVTDDVRRSCDGACHGSRCASSARLRGCVSLASLVGTARPAARSDAQSARRSSGCCSRSRPPTPICSPSPKRTAGSCASWSASSGAKRALEIGGASGYSAIWIGLGLRETGGRLTTHRVRSGAREGRRREHPRAPASPTS